MYSGRRNDGPERSDRWRRQFLQTVRKPIPTKGGISVTRRRREAPYGEAISSYVDRLDERRGAVFSSNYEYPGRYTRWDTAIIDPPLAISSFGRSLWIESL